MTTLAEATGTRNIGLLGIGSYRPERVVTNDEICENIDSSDEWIYTRTGIKSRRFARRDETVAEMSAEAGRRAIALLTGADIDAVIIATNTHYLQTPAAAVKVATELGANGVPAFDVTVGCAGFGYGMAIASDMVRGGSARRVLVIGAEQLSVSMDMTDRGNCFIFGAGDDHADRPYLRLEGTAVFRWAAFEMGKAAQQANSRINELLARSLHLPEHAVIADDIERTGNTSAASIPLAMDDLLSTGRAKPGQTALLLGYGAGLSYAAQVVKLPPVPFE